VTVQETCDFTLDTWLGFGICLSVARTKVALQDTKEEQRAKRKRLLSAAATARIKRGMIRYLQVYRPLTYLIDLENMKRGKQDSSTGFRTCEFFIQRKLTVVSKVMPRGL